MNKTDSRIVEIQTELTRMNNEQALIDLETTLKLRKQIRCEIACTGHDFGFFRWRRNCVHCGKENYYATA